jgi:PAS domain S-box-containing protein
VPLDTQTKKIPKREYRLSFIMAVGLFLIMLALTLGVLGFTYQSSLILLDQKREYQKNLGKVVSDLVFDAQITGVQNIVNLTAEDAIFQGSRDRADQNAIVPYLRGVFYGQKETDLGFLALLSSDNKVQVSFYNELFPIEEIISKIENRRGDERRWAWVSQVASGSDPIVLVYFKREVLDNLTGRVAGHLVGGFFINSDQEIIQSIRRQVGSDFSAVVFRGNILTHSGELPGDIGRHITQSGVDLTEHGPDVHYLFGSQILTEKISDSQFHILHGYEISDEASVDQFYLISVGVAVIVILALSIVIAMLARKLFLKPIGDLVVYARRAERQESKPQLLQSPIKDFNIVGQNLANVITAFQESEKRFQDFVSVSSDSVWETDAENRYVYVSREANSGQNMDLNNIVGKKRWEIQGVDQEYSDWNDHRQTLARQMPFRNYVFRRIDPNGNIKYWSASGKPRYDQDGTFIGYRGTSRDITSEVEAQKEADKIQDQLRQSQKLEIVGQLTGGVAHDFNNLLSVVLGNLELIEEAKLLEGGFAQNLADAIKGAERGALLTHQLLAYSRQQTLNPVVVEAGSVILEMRSLLERALGELVNVKTNLRNDCNVLIDPAELENALLNLAVNARDAMPNGGELLIECFTTSLDEEYTDNIPELKAGEYVCVVVSDTGEGIAEDIKEKILEPFFTTKEVGKGSGLGLSMVFGFVKQSGGHITVYSEVGKGTSIQLYLPRVKMGKQNKKDAKEQLLHQGHGEVVLIVEDNPDVLNLVSKQIGSIGYTHLECSDSSAAIEILKTQSVDLLLSDVILPNGLNGLELILAAKEIRPDLPAVLMSGFTGNAISSKEKLPDGIEILYKPFTKIRLSEALHRALHVNKR